MLPLTSAFFIQGHKFKILKNLNENQIIFDTVEELVFPVKILAWSIFYILGNCGSFVLVGLVQKLNKGALFLHILT